MRFLKKILPFLFATLLGMGLAYLIIPRFTEKVDQVIEAVPDIRIREAVQEVQPPDTTPVVCPAVDPKECPKVEPMVIWKTKYVKQYVYVPVKMKPGCSVDWQTGEVSAYTSKGISLDCVVDWKNKHVDEVLFPSSMLRSRNRRAVKP